MLWSIPNAATGLTILGKLRFSYIRLLNKSVRLRNKLLQWGLSLIYLILIGLGLGNHGSDVTLQTLGNILLLIIIIVSLVHL